MPITEYRHEKPPTKDLFLRPRTQKEFENLINAFSDAGFNITKHIRVNDSVFYEINLGKDSIDPYHFEFKNDLKINKVFADNAYCSMNTVLKEKENYFTIKCIEANECKYVVTMTFDYEEGCSCFAKTFLILWFIWKLYNW